MIRLFFLILSTSLIGCSHQAKKSEATVPANAKAESAAKTETKAQAADKSSSTKVECSVKGDERVLEVRGKGSGCELAYTKAGKEGVVASAAHGTDYCEKSLEKLRDKLKGAGYECK